MFDTYPTIQDFTSAYIDLETRMKAEVLKLSALAEKIGLLGDSEFQGQMTAAVTGPVAPEFEETPRALALMCWALETMRARIDVQNAMQDVIQAIEARARSLSEGRPGTPLRVVKLPCVLASLKVFQCNTDRVHSDVRKLIGSLPDLDADEILDQVKSATNTRGSETQCYDRAGDDLLDVAGVALEIIPSLHKLREVILRRAPRNPAIVRD